MKSAPVVFVIDDEAALLSSLKSLIELRLGYEVRVYTQTEVDAALRDARNHPPDLVILDYHLAPNLKGTDVMRRLHEQHCAAPVLFMSGEDNPTLRADVLDLSADDFLAKPWNDEELLARIQAVLRRSARAGDSLILAESRAGDPDFRFALCTVSPRSMTLTGPRSKVVMLTPHEMALVSLLHHRAGTTASREDLVHLIWGVTVHIKSRRLDQTIYTIKRRLAEVGGVPDLIVNVKSVGYRYDSGVPAGGV